MIFREKHESGDLHDHLALLAERCFRFKTLKKLLLERFGLASHWSHSHDHYASSVAYGYIPSPKKPLLELDPTPLAWLPPGKVHPPLAEACRARGGGGRRVVGGRQNVVVGWGCGAGKRQDQSSHCLASSAYLNKHQSTSVNNSQQQSTHSQHTVNTQSTRA